MSRVRVMVVDDSVVIRRLVSDILAEDPDLEVVGTAANGRLALAKLSTLSPDVVTMDIEMPEMDGVEAVREMRRSGDTTPVIMFSTLTDLGASATLDALAAGASDYVTKPANVGSVVDSSAQVRASLIPRIKALAPWRPGSATRPGSAAPGSPRRVAPATRTAPSASLPPSAPLPPHASGGTSKADTARPEGGSTPVRLAPRTRPAGGYRILVVGCSTGGPEALTRFLTGLPPLGVPVLVVQHMPALFTRQFAARLDRQVASVVTEGVSGQPLGPGTVTVAPGDFHLHVAGSRTAPTVRLSQEAPENYCRPAVDVLFRSAARLYGAQVLGVVLTGMGQDGRHGSRTIVEAGGSILVQDQATSVVWGMPGAVAGAGLAEEVLPLRDLGPAVAHRLTGALAGGSR